MGMGQNKPTRGPQGVVFGYAFLTHSQISIPPVAKLKEHLWEKANKSPSVGVMFEVILWMDEILHHWEIIVIVGIYKGIITPGFSGGFCLKFIRYNPESP